VIKNIFWNSEESRVRMLWRLVGQLLILVPVVFILQIIFGLAAYLLTILQGGLDPGVLPDFSSIQGGLTDNPIFNLIAMLGTGVSLTISIWIAGRLLDRRKFVDFGLKIDRNWWIDLGFGLGLGAVLMAVIFLIELAAGWVTVRAVFYTENPEAAFLPALLPPLILFLAVGFYEELFSRGYQLTNLAEGLSGKLLGARGGLAAAAVLSSAVFGVLHATNPNASFTSTFNIAVAGLFLAAGFLLTGQLAIPIGLHITWNFFQGNVFGFPVSGANFSTTSFIAINQGGPELWTGGAFGPEAGLLGLGAMVVGTGLTVLWVKWRYGEARLDLSISEPPVRERDEIEEPQPETEPERKMDSTGAADDPS
jgi:hypothetical protein